MINAVIWDKICVETFNAFTVRKKGDTFWTDSALTAQKVSHFFAIAMCYEYIIFNEIVLWWFGELW